MGSEYQPHSSSSGTIIAIVVAVALLALCGFLVLAGAVLFLRISAKEGREVRRVLVPEGGSVAVEIDEAVVLPEAQLAPPATDASPAPARVRKIGIRLDQQGDIVADGQPVDRDELQELLEEAREDGRVHLEVLVEVHRQCLFEHVAAVQAVCRKAGVRDVQLQALKSTSP